MRELFLKHHFLKQNRLLLFLSFFYLILAFFFNEELYGIFGEENYLSLHLVFEFFIITISLGIAIQSWMVFPHSLSRYRLWMGALFLAVGLLEIAHAITFKGMPCFVTESSSYKATWFFMVARLTEAAGLLAIVTTRDRLVATNKRWISYFVATLYAVLWCVIVYREPAWLPGLVIEGVGTTSLKNNLQYVGIAIELLIILFIIKRYRIKEAFHFMLILASIHLILADYFFTTYKNVYDINNFIGHLFQLAGFFFLLKSIYHTSVEEPFLKQKEAEDQMKQIIHQQLKDKELIQHLAFYDDLTDVPNLRFLNKVINQKISSHPDNKFALVVMDIDRFKKINEALGHSFGNRILNEFSKRLNQNIPKNMTLYRLTGDEFAILLENVEEIHNVENDLKQIQEILKEPLQVQHLLLTVTVTMGVSIYPNDGNNAEDLYKNANLALMEAQHSGYHQSFFKPTSDGRALKHLVFENDLYQALNNQELFVVYQPLINIKTMEIFGLEALVRWNHPKHGLVPPSDFIPIAEENGQIIPIGEWVLETACKQMKKWQDQGFPTLVISVNLSIRQFYQQNLVETIQKILNDYHLSPKNLELEITESMIMNNDHSMKTLHALKALGVRIAIDDFGTGYSSLSYLKHLPVDVLKIDQSFVRDLLHNEDDTMIVSTIIAIARHLNLEVIAEGVETIKQQEILSEHDCQYSQGYLYSKPLTDEEFQQQYEKLKKNIPQLLKKAGAWHLPDNGV